MLQKFTCNHYSMGLFLIHQHFGDQLGTHLSHVEIVCYDGVHSAYLKVQCLCNHPNIHSMVRVQQITHTSHIFIDVAGSWSSRAGVAGHLFPILFKPFQSPWNLQRHYRRIPVGLLDQLISISVTSAEFGAELDRVPLFDHLLHCASWHRFETSFTKSTMLTLTTTRSRLTLGMLWSQASCPPTHVVQMHCDVQSFYNKITCITLWTLLVGLKYILYIYFFYNAMAYLML